MKLGVTHNHAEEENIINEKEEWEVHPPRCVHKREEYALYR
jgi:hypothetical protein